MNLNKALAETISKTAARATRKPITNLRRDVAMLKREIAELKRLVRDLGRKNRPAPAPVSEKQKAPWLRPTSKAVLKLRRRLALSQAEFAKLAGVSALTVYNWEKAGGRIRMRGPALAGFARAKAMGKRQAVKALVTQTSPERKQDQGTEYHDEIVRSENTYLSDAGLVRGLLRADDCHFPDVITI